MSVPTVKFTKKDGNTGVVRPSVEGVLAIIAPCQQGTANQPASYAKHDLAQTDFGYGILTDAAAYIMPVAGKPVVLIRGTGGTVGANGTVTHGGAGTSVVTATGVPLDDFDVVFTFLTGGTIGTAGITFNYSLDGGVTKSATIDLGTANTYTIPNTGVAIAFAAGTVLANQTESFAATGPRMTNANLVTALEALRTSTLPWEGVLVLGLDATATELATLDVWLAARENEGRFRFGVVGARPKNSGEAESAYATAMSTAWSAASSIRVCVTADATDLVSPVRGFRMKRPPSIPYCARAMLYDVSRNPAYVADGPLPSVKIDDLRGNPKHHDEAFYPGLDALRLVSLRSIYGKEGVFFNRARVLSPTGSDYVLLPHVRVMNKACEIAYQLLTDELNKGVRVKDADAQGRVYILEEDAAAIEQRINSKLEAEFLDKKRVSDIAIVLSRTDDLAATSGTRVTGDLQVSPLRYIEDFEIDAKLVKSVTVAAS